MNYSNKTEMEALRARTDFSPLEPGGTNFAIHSLDFEDPACVRVKVTHSGLVFAGVFIATGTGFAIGAIRLRIFFLLIFSAVFIIFGFISLFMILRKRAVFDFRAGYFMRGRQKVDLNRVAALQVVVEQCRGKNTSFISRELNLVLDDASRINVFDHGNMEKFSDDLARLSRLLNCPVWDSAASYPPGTPPSDALPPDAKPKHVPRILGVFFLLFPSVFFIAFTIWPLCQLASSLSWEPCPGVVTVSRLETSRGSKGGTTYKINIQADFVRQGRHYTCRKYDFFRSSVFTNIGVSGMRDAVSSHPVGTRVMCLIDPDNPERSVMTRDVPALQLILMTAFLLPFWAIGFFFLLGASRKKQSLPHKPDCNS